MSRWHEPGCKRPEVIITGGVPYCNYCFALSLIEDTTPRTDSCSVHHAQPNIQSHINPNVAWPLVVNYSVSVPAINNGSDVFPQLSYGDEIRLLRLSSSKNSDDPIHARIETARLRSSSPRTYEAMSYNRADESDEFSKQSPVFIGPYWNIVYVTYSCAEALRSVRYQGKDRLLWVNCLCVDQENVFEKTRQASLLRDIYVSASAVIVYLGGASSDSEIAMDHLRETAAGFPTPYSSKVIGPKARTALQSLFSRSYFSRLQAIQEVVLARHLEIVCGQCSVSWPNRPSRLDFSGLSAPSWFFDRMSWDGFSGHSLLRLLLDTSSYKCSDPRDKIFGVLGLLTGDMVTPDYTLPVESVYTTITAHLVKSCLAFEVLVLACDKKDINLPSWVPDWSQKLTQHFPDVLHQPDEYPWDVDNGIDFAMSLIFDNVTEFESEVDVDVGTGLLQTRGIKLCDIPKESARLKCQNRIIMDLGQYGILIIRLMNRIDQAETDDAVFLLVGWDHPVLLRAQGMDSYVLVSVCAMYWGPPPSGPWTGPGDFLALSGSNGIRVSRFSHDENNAIRDFCSTLIEISRDGSGSPQEPQALPAMRDIFLDFNLLLSTGLPGIESRLREEWDGLDRSLGWMFRDKIATRQLLLDLNSQSSDGQSGKETLQLEELEESQFESHGIVVPFSYKWHLIQFCQSFIQLPVPGSAAVSDQTWTPVYSRLKSQLADIQQWAKVTAQLLALFDLSKVLLDNRWSSFPGNQLSSKWEDLCNAMESANAQDDTSLSDETKNPWDWSEFKETLRLRKRLWNSTVPPQLDRSTNSNIASRLALKRLGLAFEDLKTIKLV